MTRQTKNLLQEVATLAVAYAVTSALTLFMTLSWV